MQYIANLWFEWEWMELRMGMGPLDTICGGVLAGGIKNGNGTGM